MKFVLSTVLLVTLALNTVQASCISDFETKAHNTTERDSAIGGLTVFAGTLLLAGVIGPFALIATGAGVAWIYKDSYLPSSATKMTQLILDSQLLIDHQDGARATLEKHPNALARLDLIVKRATGLTSDDGDEFTSARQEIAKIIYDSNESRELCNQKLVKFSNVDEFVKAKL